MTTTQESYCPTADLDRFWNDQHDDYIKNQVIEQNLIEYKQPVQKSLERKRIQCCFVCFSDVSTRNNESHDNNDETDNNNSAKQIERDNQQKTTSTSRISSSEKNQNNSLLRPSSSASGYYGSNLDLNNSYSSRSSSPNCQQISNSTSNSNVKPLLTHRSQSTRTNINHISQLNSPRTNFQNNRHQSVSNLLGDSSRQKNTINKGGLERRFSVKPSGLMGTLTRKMSKIWTKGEVDSNNSNLSSGHSGNNFFGVS